MSPETMDVESPGTAVARQAAIEAHLYSSSEKFLRYFLADIAERAWREKAIYPPLVASLWRNFVNDVMIDQPEDVAEYVRSEFELSDIPDDVYSATQAVLAAARENFASGDQLRSELQRVLNPDGFAVEQITASIGWVETEEQYQPPMDSLTAAAFWDNLADTGSIWIRRIRRVTRTSATGLSGWITVTAIRIQDYPQKRWVTRHDDNVRHSHRAVDGVTIPVDENFIVGGFPMKYPGERDAEYGEIVNCRCVLVGVK